MTNPIVHFEVVGEDRAPNWVHTTAAYAGTSAQFAEARRPVPAFP